MFLVRENGRGGDGGGIFTIVRRAFAEKGGLRRDRKVEIHQFSHSQQQNTAEPWVNPSPFPPESAVSSLFLPFPIGGPTIKVAAKWTRGEEGRIANAAATITLQFFFVALLLFPRECKFKLCISSDAESFMRGGTKPILVHRKNTLVVSSGLRHFWRALLALDRWRHECAKQQKNRSSLAKTPQF